MSSSRSPMSYSRISQKTPFLDDSRDEIEPRPSSTESNETLTLPRRQTRPWYRRYLLPYAIVLTLSLATNLLLAVPLAAGRGYCKSNPMRFSNLDGGFETDLEAARPHIETKLVYFTGSVAFYENGTMYRDYPKDQPRYVGEPNAQIDKAWSDLLYGMVVDLPGHLAGKMKDVTWQEVDADLYRTGLDVFHQLHCLDYIRRGLYPEYYGQEDITRLYRMHLDHCVDYIRQALMCAADSTPVRLEWRKESHFLIPKFDMPHTCRNFDLLKKFHNEHALEKYNVENQRKINEKHAQGLL